MNEKIIKILKNIKPGIDYTNEKSLFTDKILDSLEFVQLIGELEDEFGVAFDFDDMDPANFDSVEMIAERING